MTNNIHFLLGSPETNIADLTAQEGAFYLTSHKEKNQNANRLYIGTSSGVKSITTPTPYYLNLQLNGNEELTEYSGAENKTVNFTINSDGIYQQGSNHVVTHYAVCKDSGNSGVKTAPLLGYQLVPGARVHITFTNTNTAENPTLNINNTGAISIDFNNKLKHLINGVIYTFIYDGNKYILLNENHRINNIGAEVFNASENKATGEYSHAEGSLTYAAGLGSHAQNLGTIARGEAQTTLGKYNIEDTTSALIIGNGDSNSTRSNAYTIDWSGNSVQSGTIIATGETLYGNLILDNSASAQSGEPYIQWGNRGNNTPYIGFAADQTDGTFVICSMEKDTTTNGVRHYKNGLAIGGGSGNLFWKGSKIITVDSQDNLTNKTYDGYTLGPACAKNVDTTVVKGSTNLITSGAVYAAIYDAIAASY